MLASFRSSMYISLAVLFIFLIGFSLSSGIVPDISKTAVSKAAAALRVMVQNHCATLHVFPFQKSRWHYFLLPEGAYTAALYTKPVSFPTACHVVTYALINALFQPLFFCVLTPQTIFNLLLLPFFMYGAFKYFKKVPIMILAVIGFYIYAGLYGSVVEALVRHRVSWELIYLLIGIAGFTDLISEKLF